MQYIKLYETYTSSMRLDDILDHISKNGIDSISDEDKFFLDSHMSDKQHDVNNELLDKPIVLNKEYENQYFTFILKTISYKENYECFNGILSLPDYVDGDGMRISGNKIEGYIEHNIISNDVELQFSRNGILPYDFAEGLEYELESFIDEIIDENSKYLNED